MLWHVLAHLRFLGCTQSRYELFATIRVCLSIVPLKIQWFLSTCSSWTLPVWVYTMFGQTHKQFPKTNSNAALVAYSPQGCSGLDIVGTSQKGIEQTGFHSRNGGPRQYAAMVIVIDCKFWCNLDRNPIIRCPKRNDWVNDQVGCLLPSIKWT